MTSRCDGWMSEEIHLSPDRLDWDNLAADALELLKTDTELFGDASQLIGSVNGMF